MMWTVIRTLAPDLSPEFTSQFETFHRVAIGIASQEPRWQFCLSDLNYNKNLLGIPLGLVFVKEKFSGDSKKQVMRALKNRLLYVCGY